MKKLHLLVTFLLFCVDLDAIKCVSIYKACEDNWLITWKIIILKTGYYFQFMNTKYVNFSRGNIF